MPSRNCKSRPISWRISSDKRVNDLKDPWAMLAYTWLIPSADNMGRMEGDEDIVASMIFPRQRGAVPPERMVDILQQLHNAGLLYWYEINKEKFIQFPATSWDKHQKMVGNMKAESDFPAPESAAYFYWFKDTRQGNKRVHTGINEFEPVCNEEEEKKKRKEEEDEEKRAREDVVVGVVRTEQSSNGFTSVVDAFNKNIHPITPVEAEKIGAWLVDGLEPEVLIFAIEQAAMAGNRTASYINGILLNLHSEGIITRAQAEARERDRIQQKRRKKSSNPEQQRAPATQPLTVEDQKRIQEADKLIAELSKGMVMPGEL